MQLLMFFRGSRKAAFFCSGLPAEMLWLPLCLVLLVRCLACLAPEPAVFGKPSRQHDDPLRANWLQPLTRSTPAR
jgi:hypothetical protein